MVAFTLFLLGLASGLTLLAISAYRHVSPPWLKWLLMISGILLMSRYAMMARLVAAEGLSQAWIPTYYWMASSIGLTLPAVFAVDQLIRHPAMTPRKLLAWSVPLLAADGAVLFGARVVFVVVHVMFLIGFVGICLLLTRKIPSPRIQGALRGLAVVYGYLGFDLLLVTSGRWGVTPLLRSEPAVLLALWYAYETSAALQRSA